MKYIAILSLLIGLSLALPVEKQSSETNVQAFLSPTTTWLGTLLDSFSQNEQAMAETQSRETTLRNLICSLNPTLPGCDEEARIAEFLFSINAPDILYDLPDISQYAKATEQGVQPGPTFEDTLRSLMCSFDPALPGCDEEARIAVLGRSIPVQDFLCIIFPCQRTAAEQDAPPSQPAPTLEDTLRNLMCSVNPTLPGCDKQARIASWIGQLMAGIHALSIHARDYYKCLIHPCSKRAATGQDAMSQFDRLPSKTDFLTTEGGELGEIQRSRHLAGIHATDFTCFIYPCSKHAATGQDAMSQFDRLPSKTDFSTTEGGELGETQQSRFSECDDLSLSYDEFTSCYLRALGVPRKQ